jgi:hypothetical protein
LKAIRHSQGILTYALLKTIKQNPAILENGKLLDVSKWFNAAKELVSEIVKENNARQEPQLFSTNNFTVGIVDDEVRREITLAEEKPLFANSNLQNSDEAIAADDMGLGGLVDNQLMNISSKGSEAPIVFINTPTSESAYILSGRYEVKGNTVTVRINIRQNKEVKQRFEVTGTKDNLKTPRKLLRPQLGWLNS